jgi:hypothetical protein
MLDKEFVIIMWELTALYSPKSAFPVNVAKIMAGFSKIAPRHSNHFAEKIRRLLRGTFP